METSRSFGPLWLRHVVVILIVLSSLTLLFYLTQAPDEPQNSWTRLFLQLGVGLVVFMLPPIYFTVFVLIPRMLVPKQFYSFLGSATLMVVSWAFLISKAEPYVDHHWFGEPYQARDASPAVAVMAFVILLTTFLNLSYRWLMQLTRIKQLENDQLTQELTLLKSQLSPHFFFNTLNNLYALALEQAPETPEVILKLSALMRHTIYQGEKATVALSEEVEYLHNYLALQALRHFDQADIRFQHQVADEAPDIPPLLLIVFIENAFKHGLESQPEGCFVHIELSATAEQIRFQIRNNFVPAGSESGGLGLENTRRRLQLLYPNRHSLDITVRGNEYNLTLVVHP